MALDRHRPGVLKQQNKQHKHGKHRSKGQIHKDHKGRVSMKTSARKLKKDLKRSDKKNLLKQLRASKKEVVLNQKRSLGTKEAPPFLCLFIPLGNGLSGHFSKLISLIKEADPSAVITKETTVSLHITVPRLKQRFEFALHSDTRDVCGALDLCKVATNVIFLYSEEEEGVSEDGSYLLSAIFAQGLPTPSHLLLGASPKKGDLEKKQKEVMKEIQAHFPGAEEKLWNVRTSGEALLFLRQLGSQKQRAIAFRDFRPHLLSDAFSFSPSQDEPGLGLLKVRGYVRGTPLDVNQLVHIPGWGDFQMSGIYAVEDPHPLILGNTRRPRDVDMSELENKLLASPDPVKQVPLEAENVPDEMEGEQTWPTEEELVAAGKAQKKKKKVPKGTSEYQAAWILDDDDEEDSPESPLNDSSGGEMDDEEPDEEESMAEESAEEEAEGSEEEGDDEEESGDDETMSMSDVKAVHFDLDQEKEELKKVKAAREDEMFPDELDTPMDTPARVRFQKYRGLESFRDSPWDAKENLPWDYSRIFAFQNFHHMRRRILKAIRSGTAFEDASNIQVGRYVEVHVKSIPVHLIQEKQKEGNSPLVLFGLLPHEHKMSVMNYVIRGPAAVADDTQPIKSKEKLIFHVGFRRFASCPIFSQHSHGDKHKMERFLRASGTVVASCFAPITFSPCPVVVFRLNSNGSQSLVGMGSVLSADPNRVVVKRIVLSGYPFKVYKRSVVVRFMFFNREDAEWFKPVELHSKYGRRGHIKEPLGTHGLMKCNFDGRVKSQDTILMNLYKRVFPKWTYDPFVPSTAQRQHCLTNVEAF